MKTQKSWARFATRDYIAELNLLIVVCCYRLKQSALKLGLEKKLSILSFMVSSPY